MVLRQGWNCWKIDHASRVSVLVDGAAYFEALRATMEKAENFIFILGWDIDSRIRLRHDSDETLRDFLKELLERKPGLHVYVLTWDYHLIYAHERENSLRLKWDMSISDRLHFQFDDTHPMTASHHQKVVVIDDILGFSGGLDITQRRWDNAGHDAVNPARIDPKGRPYGPFHDVQIMLEGAAVRTLGDLARQRWYDATGESVNLGSEPARALWPAAIDPHLRNIRVGISRTFPEYYEREEVREIERLYLDSIASAHDYIYIENQYLTSIKLSAALVDRLSRPDGPEVIIVVPCFNTGLESFIMETLRYRTVKRLLASDRYGKLRIYYPSVDSVAVNLHSKVFIADDIFLRVGSANFNNRSLGMDTECDVALEAEPDSHESRVICQLKNRLLGEHLGCDHLKVEEAIRDKGLIAGVDGLRGGSRTLESCSGEVPQWLDTLVPSEKIMDPEKPYTSTIRRRFFKNKGLRAFTGILLLMLALYCVWTFTPLREWAHPHKLALALKPFSEKPIAPLVFIGGFFLLATLMVSVNVLAVSMALLLDPIHAFIYSLTGSVLSSIVIFYVGRAVGTKPMGQLHGKRLDVVRDYISSHGFRTVAILRCLPLAPHWAVNLAIGSMPIGIWPFIGGTILGLFPGIALISYLGEEAGRALKSPVTVGLIALAWIGLVSYLAHHLKKRIEMRADNGGPNS